MEHQYQIWTYCPQYRNGWDFIDLCRNGKIYTGVVTVKEGQLIKDKNIIRFRRVK